MLGFLKKIFLKRSAGEITKYLSLIKAAHPNEISTAIAHAALLHYRFKTLDPDFIDTLNSDRGENQGPISIYIIQFNKTQNQFIKQGQQENATGLKMWNITLRCMSDESFHHYGVTLWSTLPKYFDGAKEYLQNELEIAKDSEDENMKDASTGALKIYDFIPPQFKSS